jgi:hypothetical protein
MKDDIVYSFCKNIEVMDKYRYLHKENAFIRYTSRSFLERMNLAKMVDGRLENYDKDLWMKVQKEHEQIVESLGHSRKDKIFIFISVIGFLMSGVLIFMMLFYRILIFLLLLGIVLIVTLTISLKIIFSRAQKSIQKSYEQKDLVQD